MEAENILKIADINSDQLSEEIIDFFTNECEPTYRDQVLKEHIYNIQDIFDARIEEEDLGSPIMIAVREIHTICFDNECGYFRIIFA